MLWFRNLIWATLLATVAAAQTPSTLDYTQWRGNGRDGSASGFIPPATWPDHLTRGWSVDVGEGYGTPLVVGTVVYTFTRRGGDEVLTALNAADGRVLWRSAYAAPYEVGQPAAAHGAGPKATPLFYRGKVFTCGVSGIVAAFDAATGKKLWSTPSPGEAPYFSAAASPVADEGLVITHPGNYEPLTAFDVDTGAVKWVAGGEGLFASPIVATFDGQRQVISATLRSIAGVSLPDGRLLWEYPFQNNGGITPVLDGGGVIVSGLDLGVAAIKPVKRSEQWTVETVWQTKAVSMYVSNPVVLGGTLFGLSHRASGQYFALDAASGATLWLGPPRQAANTALVKAGSWLLLLDDNGTLTVARSSRDRLEVEKRYTVAASSTWAQPAVSGRRIFIKDVKSLTLWTVE